MAVDATAIKLDDDYLTWERLEPITYYPAPVRDDKSLIVPRAKRRAPTTKEVMASGGVYTSTDIVWLIPRLEAKGLAEQFPPKPADMIEDADQASWTVLQVAPYGALRSFWRCMTRNLTLAFDLRDAVDILRPTITKGSAAEPLFAWPTDATPGGTYVVADLAARVQPAGADNIGIRNEIETVVKSLNVILAAQVDVRYGDRVVVKRGDFVGQVLRILSMSSENRIDELPYLVCERV